PVHAPDRPILLAARRAMLHGADHPTVPPNEVEAFEEEMRDAKVDRQLVAYGNTVHGFADPGAGRQFERCGLQGSLDSVTLNGGGQPPLRLLAAACQQRGRRLRRVWSDCQG